MVRPFVTLPAFAAGVGLVSRMYVKMQPQARRLSEGFVADVAFVRLFVGVESLVDLQGEV